YSLQFSLSSCGPVSVFLSRFFFFYSSGAHRVLHSFPTRRSSDLRTGSSSGPDRRLPVRSARGCPSCSRPSRERNRSRCNHAQNRSEEHTSELQSRGHLVCRLLLEKKKKTTTTQNLTLL